MGPRPVAVRRDVVAAHKAAERARRNLEHRVRESLGTPEEQSALHAAHAAAVANEYEDRRRSRRPRVKEKQDG
jgi:hypothetical protein